VSEGRFISRGDSNLRGAQFACEAFFREGKTLSVELRFGLACLGSGVKDDAPHLGGALAHRHKAKDRIFLECRATEVRSGTIGLVP